jgi:hypothetical protein
MKQWKLLAVIVIGLFCGCGGLTTTPASPNSSVPSPNSGAPISQDPYNGILPAAKGSATVTFSDWSPEWPSSISSTTFQPDIIRASNTTTTTIVMYADGQEIICRTSGRAKQNTTYPIANIAEKPVFNPDDWRKVGSNFYRCKYIGNFTIQDGILDYNIAQLTGYSIYGCGGGLTISSITPASMTFSFLGKYCFAKQITTIISQNPVIYQISYSDIKPALTISFSGTVENILEGITLLQAKNGDKK